MKSASISIFAGIALLFLAAFYSIAPMLQNYFVVGYLGSYTRVPEGFLFNNYWFCQIFGICFLLFGVWTLWQEKTK